MGDVPHLPLRGLEFVGKELEQTQVKTLVYLQTCLEEFEIEITRLHRLESGRRDRVMMILAKTAVAKQAAFPGKPDDQLFLRAPFLVYFDRAAIHEINALHLIPFLEDQLPFLIREVLSVYPDGRDPFRETSLTEKTAFEIAVTGLFLHNVQDIVILIK